MERGGLDGLKREQPEWRTALMAQKDCRLAKASAGGLRLEQAFRRACEI
jgi:hypothetical protein